MTIEHEPEIEMVEPVKAKKYYFWLSRWENYLKRIPKRGLNNITKQKSYEYKGKTYIYDRGGEPTIKRRLKKICVGGIFGASMPPFFYYAGSMMTNGTEKENLPKIKELTKQILDRLEALHGQMDTVNVLPKNEVEYWKNRIRETIYYIRKQSRWVGLMLIQETEFKVLEEKESIKDTTTGLNAI